MEDSRVNVPVSWTNVPIAGTSLVGVYSAMSVAVKLSRYITFYEGEISSLN